MVHRVNGALEGQGSDISNKSIYRETIKGGGPSLRPHNKKVVVLQFGKSLNTTLNFTPSAKALVAIILRYLPEPKALTTLGPREYRWRTKAAR